MKPRLKVLLSAFACRPGKGSEPEVGWQFGMHMAQLHNVTVVTRSNNRETIEAALAGHEGPKPEFIYYDLPAWMRELKRRGVWVAIYYFFWQLGIRFYLHPRLKDFDLIHHVTFNSFRHTGFWWFCPCPVILGPLGGGQICPWRYLPWFRKQIVYEILRSLSVVNSYLLPHIYLNFYFADKILIANKDTGRCVPWMFRDKIEYLLETAITSDQVLDPLPVKIPHRDVRLLWVSRLDKMKGGELALRSVALALTQMQSITLTLVGGGREDKPLKRLAKSLGIENSVIWVGKIPKAEIQNFMAQYDVFLFTSFRDTSGNVVLEAMAAGLPVITFNHHGVAEITTAETALRIPLAGRDITVNRLSGAILTLSGSPKWRAQLGTAGWNRVKEHYTWIRHAEKVSGIYRAVENEGAVRELLQKRMLKALRSIRGIAWGLTALLLIGSIEFFSLGRLKQTTDLIAKDTLPSLSSAGEVNATMTQSFNRLLLLIITDDFKQQEYYSKEIFRFSQQTTALLKNYEKILSSPRERELFGQLVEKRNSYLKSRDAIVLDIQKHQKEKALAEYKENALPAFLEYKTAGDSLIEFEIYDGRQKSDLIIRNCNSARYSAAIIGVMLFLCGLAIGFFK